MRILSICGNDFIAHWAYEETISLHTEHTRKQFHCTLSIRRRNFRVNSASGKMLTVFTCTAMLSIRGNDFIAPWAYEEIIKTLAEHTRKYFIADWAYMEMFKSRISRRNRIWFSKISWALCSRDYKDSVSAINVFKKISCLCTFKLTIPGSPNNVLPVSCGDIGFSKSWV